MRFALWSLTLLLPQVLSLPAAVTEGWPTAAIADGWSIPDWASLWSARAEGSHGMNDHNDNDGPHGKDDRCDVSKLPIPLPANQTTLVQPTDQTLQLVTLGRGVQNYTCVNGTYVSAGALADLYDLNCVAAYTAVIGLPGAVPALTKLALEIPFPSTSEHVTISHEFVTTPNGIAPSFYTQTKRSTFTRKASIPSPDGAQNIAWLELVAIPGQDTLASTAFRIFTVGGQPPATCDSGAVSVPYAALYYFLS